MSAAEPHVKLSVLYKVLSISTSGRQSSKGHMTELWQPCCIPVGPLNIHSMKVWGSEIALSALTVIANSNGGNIYAVQTSTPYCQ